jgi:hypothetical protein
MTKTRTVERDSPNAPGVIRTRDLPLRRRVGGGGLLAGLSHRYWGFMDLETTSRIERFAAVCGRFRGVLAGLPFRAAVRALG